MTHQLLLRQPTAQDGAAVNRLIQECPPLDTNSTYCNLLQCTHFPLTSICASAGESLVGFVSAYIIPDKPNTLFVWQVAISEQARGQGLAQRMLLELIDRPNLSKIRFIETTITEHNRPSWKLFERLTATLNCQLLKSNFFDKQLHFNGQHDSEILVRIGPFNC